MTYYPNRANNNLWSSLMSVYAIKVWLSKSEKDWFLYKDLEDHVVHTWSRKEKAEEVMNLLTCFKAEITEDIPAPALARSTEKKQKLKLET